jgi:peptidoglycan L-alanyl-D-glutamate endopeptidase CwlK
MNHKIQKLDPRVIPYFEKFLVELDDKKYLYSIVETLRTIEIQAAYYSQGRKPLEEVNTLRKIAGLYLIKESENKIITNTMDSLHLKGLAADIVPVINDRIPWNINTPEIANLYKEFGRIGMSVGLEWGGNWKPFDSYGIGWDAPHYQRIV